MKTIVSYLLVLALLLSCVALLCACGGIGEDEASQSMENTLASESASDTEKSEDTSVETSDTTKNGQESDWIVYPVAENTDRIWQTATKLEFCATYEEGAVWIKASSNKITKYLVYVNGEKTGSVSFSAFGTPVELPGTLEAAGEAVSIRLLRENYDANNDVTFVDVRVNGTLVARNATSVSDGAMTDYHIAANTEKIKVQGRSTTIGDEVATDWSASGIEFHATYTGAIYLQGRGAANTIRFGVYVNGTETGIVSFAGGALQTKLLPGTFCTTETEAHIRLVRLEYVKDGLATLRSVLLEGTIGDWTEKNRPLIEFIGDSITCGFGSVTPDSTKNGAKTYAYLTADALNADYSMIAISGIGVNKSTDQHSGGTIGDFYKYNCYYRNQSALYTPQKQADLVVVNLNTNDFARGATEGAYKEDLKAFLADIRSIHGEDVTIVWIIGQMISANASVNQWMTSVFEELGGEAAGLYIMRATQNTSGGVGHPDYTSHQNTAEKLINLIEQKKWI